MNVTICPRVTIGEYAVVAAGAVVTKDDRMQHSDRRGLWRRKGKLETAWRFYLKKRKWNMEIDEFKGVNILMAKGGRYNE